MLIWGSIYPESLNLVHPHTHLYTYYIIPSGSPVTWLVPVPSLPELARMCGSVMADPQGASKEVHIMAACQTAVLGLYA